MPRPSTIAAAAVLFLACSVLVLADEQWVLTTADFHSQAAVLEAIDDAGVTLTAGGQRRTIPLDQFVQIEREIPHQDEGLILHLVRGERLSGLPLEMTDQHLRWEHPALGEMTVPLEELDSIVRGNHQPDPPARRGQDVIRLMNRDMVAGIAAGMDGQAITMSVGGDVLPVPLESVAAVYFAVLPGGASPAVDGSRFRLRLDDGSVIIADRLELAGEKALVSIGGGERPLAAAHLVAIEQIDGPVSWLSEREPVENVQVPFLGESWPARMNRTVRGEPIRFGDRTFTRGIGVHAYSRMSWELDGNYSMFRTQYAIDGDGQYANVTVRILLDDEVVHEEEDVTAGELSPVIEIELKQAQKLTLEVDYGRMYDVQDRFNWIEPALVRQGVPAQ